MNVPKRKLIVVLGTVALLVMAVTLKRPALEQWYLWQLESENEEERAIAAETLGEMNSVRAVPKLAETLAKEPGPYARTRIADALRGIVPGAVSAVDAVPALIDALKADHEDVRGTAAEILGKIGSQAKAAIPALGTALATDKSVSVRTVAAGALGEIGRGVKDAVPVLEEALKCRFDDVRDSAAYALGEIGPEAAGALPSLRDTLKDPVGRVKWSAAEAIRKIEELRGR